MPRRCRERGQAIVLLLIALAVVGGLAWWLSASREKSQEAATAFAREAGVRLGRQFDRRFLDVHIAPEVQTRFPASFRDRVIEHLQRFGVADENVEVEGDVAFTNHFFQPRGTFKVHLFYPSGMKADLYLTVSDPHGWWQIDYANLVWYPPGQTAPAGEAAPPAP